MLIRRISANPSFGILSFIHTTEIIDFNRFNLIYGWNRSGKTTLSRIITSIQNQFIDFDQYPENGEFEVKTDSGISIKPENISNPGLSARVFNKDFIEDNVSFDSSECNPIIYISESDISSKKDLEDLIKHNNDTLIKLQGIVDKKNLADRAINSFLESTARNIKDTIGILQVDDEYRTYNKATLRTFLENNSLVESNELSDEDFDEHRTLTREDAKLQYDLLSPFDFNLDIDGTSFDDFPHLDAAIDDILNQNIVSETIDRLKDDPILNNWVKSGLEIQKNRDEFDKCPYCEKPIEISFLEHLNSHFNTDDLPPEN